MKQLLLSFALAWGAGVSFAEEVAVTRAPAGPSQNANQLRAALLSSPETYRKIVTTALLSELLADLPDTAKSRETLRKFATESFSEDEQYIGKHVELNAILQKRWENTIESLSEVAGGAKFKRIPLWADFVKLGEGFAKNAVLQELDEHNAEERKRVNLQSDEETAHKLLDVYNVADSFQKSCEAKPELCASLRSAFLSNFGFDPLASVEENELRMPGVLLQKRVEGLAKDLPQMRQELMDLAALLGEDLKSMQSQLQGLAGNMEGLASAFDKLLKKVESSSLSLNQKLLSKLTKEEKDRMTHHVRSLERTALYNSAYLVGGIARSIDGKSGAVFEGVLRSGLMVRDAIKAFQASTAKELTSTFTGKRAGQLLFSSVNLVAGIAQAAELVLGLIFGGDPNAAVMKMLQDISKQISDLQERMEIRFDQIDLRLNTVIKTVLSTFEILAAQNQQLLADTSFMKAQLQGLHEALIQLGHMTRIYEQASAGRTWALSKSVCVTPPGTLLSTANFMTCMKLFYSSVGFAEDALATNSTADVENAAEREQVSTEMRQVSTLGPSWLDSIRGQTVWDWINPVAALSGTSWAVVRADNQLNANSIAVHNLDNLFYQYGTSGKIPNVVALRAHVLQLKQVIDENKALIPDLTYQERRFVESIVQLYRNRLGRAQMVLSDLVRLKVRKYSGSDAGMSTTVQTLAQHYRQAFSSDYQQFLARERRKYSEFQLKFVDFLKPIEGQTFEDDKEVSHSAESIPACSPDKPAIRTAYSVSLKKDGSGTLNIGQVVYNISRAGSAAGRFEACYTTAQWAETSEKYQFVHLGRVLSAISAFVQQLDAKNEKGQKVFSIPEEPRFRKLAGRMFALKQANAGKKDDEFLIGAADLAELEWAYSAMGSTDVKNNVDLKFMYMFGKPALEVELRFIPQGPGGKDDPFIVVAKELVTGPPDQQFGIAAIGSRNFGDDIGKDLAALPQLTAGRRTFYYDTNFVADIANGEGVRRSVFPEGQEEKYRSNVVSYYVDINLDKLHLPSKRVNHMHSDARKDADAAVTKAGNEWLARQRARFNATMADSLHKLEHPEEKELMLRFELLKTAIALAFPVSIEKDDRMRALLLGALAIPNPIQMTLAAVHCGLPLDSAFESSGYAVRVQDLRAKGEEHATTSSHVCKLMMGEIAHQADGTTVDSHSQIYSARFDGLDKWLHDATAAGREVEKYPLIVNSFVDLEDAGGGLSKPATHDEISAAMHKVQDAAENILRRPKPVGTTTVLK